MHIAASQCSPSLEIIEAVVDDNAAEAIQFLCKACPYIRNLYLGNNSSNLDGDAIVQTVAKYCPFIEVLSTDRWTLTDAGLDALATIHYLTELSVRSDDCTSAAVQRVLRANPNLTVLSIYIPGIDDALVSCIGRCSGNLTRLDLHQDRVDHTVGTHTFMYVSYKAFIDLFRGCPLLESVILYQQSGMSNATLRALFDNCHYLREVTLVAGAFPGGSLLDDEPVLCTYYPTLTKLDVSYGGVSGSALRSIFTYCTNLRELRASCNQQVTDEIIKVLAQNCTYLNTLRLRGCISVTVAGLLEVATHCKNLRHFHLHNIPISDEVLASLSLNCRSLRSLTLLYCHSGDGVVTEAGILALLEGCTDLTSLTVQGSIVAKILISTLDLAKLKQLYPHIKYNICLDTPLSEITALL